jgi:3-hydroxyacyl-CoA dehydrogenase
LYHRGGHHGQRHPAGLRCGWPKIRHCRHLRRGVRSSLDRLVKKEKTTIADREAALARITATTDKAKFATCDLVIEAPTENVELKLKMLKDLCATLKSEALAAIDTSSIIDHEAGCGDRPSSAPDENRSKN